MCGAPISTSIIFYWFLAVNCMYWEKRFPRLLSTQQLKELKEKGSPLVGISDITCDVGGSIEFVNQTTSFAKPFFRYFFYVSFAKYTESHHVHHGVLLNC